MNWVSLQLDGSSVDVSTDDGDMGMPPIPPPARDTLGDPVAGGQWQGFSTGDEALLREVRLIEGYMSHIVGCMSHIVDCMSHILDGVIYTGDRINPVISQIMGHISQMVGQRTHRISHIAG